MLFVVAEPDEHPPLALKQSSKDCRLHTKRLPGSERRFDLLAGLNFDPHIRGLRSVIDWQPDLLAHTKGLPAHVIEGGHNVLNTGRDLILSVFGRATRFA